MRYARGKTLGGCSARNYMAFHRGTTGSYQRWADEVHLPEPASVFPTKRALDATEGEYPVSERERAI